MGEISEIKKCPNCGFSPFHSDYCPECGQRKLTEKDFSIKSLTGDFFDGIFNLENSFLKTIKALLTYPSKYAAEYNKGARKKYVSPVKLFIIANAIYFLFPSINAFTTTLNIQLNGLPYSDLLRAFVEQQIAISGLGAEFFEAEYNRLTTNLSKTLLILLPFCFGIITWITDFRNRKHNPLMFHLNRSLVFHSFLLLIVVSVIPGILAFLIKGFEIELLYGVFNNVSVTIGTFLIMNTYGYFAYKGFFGGNIWLKLIRVVILNLAFYALIMAYRALLLFVTLFWMKAF